MHILPPSARTLIAEHGIGLDRRMLAEFFPELMLLPAEFDPAITGVAENGGGLQAACYDYEGVLKVLRAQQGWSDDEAIDWFYGNVLPGAQGPNAPLFLFRELG